MTITSKKLQRSVLEVLRTSGQPMKTSEIARILERSVTSIASACKDAGADFLPDTRPVEWIYPAEQIAAQEEIKVKSSIKGQRFSVVGDPNIATIERWNLNRKELGKQIAELNITYKSDAKAVATSLANVAGAMAALSAQIHEVSGKTDWFLLLTENKG